MKFNYSFYISRFCAFGICCFFLLSSACVSTPDINSLEPGEYTDQIIRGKIQPGQPGVAVLVSRGDRVLFSKGYGLADIARKTPIATDSKFRIGSISKQFTAAAILKLQEADKLKVMDRLSKYIPDYPGGDEVTLHHLLTHTSGIENYTDKIDFRGRVSQATTTEDLIELFKYDEFNFKPGDSFSYSNSGYFLLGYIIEKVSGKSYLQYLQETFFTPLGMNDSGVYRADSSLDNEALGYSYIDGVTRIALNWDMSHAGAAGALYSTVEDLHRWNKAVFNDQVLDQESLAAALTGAKITISSELTDYGYGWALGEQGGLKLIHHSGGLDGFSSYLARFPEKDLTIAVLHNASPGFVGVSPFGIAQEIARAYLRQEMMADGDSSKTTREVDDSVNPESYQSFAGDYDYGPLAILEVKASNNRLFAQLTGQREFRIYPESPNKYFWKIVDAQIEFLKDSNGKVVAARHTQNGRSFLAPKLEKIATVEVPKQILDQYVGVYGFDNIGKFTVTRKRDVLVVQVPPEFRIPKNKLEIFGKSRTLFFSPFFRKIKIEFVSNGEEKVEQAIIHQGSSRFEGVRIE